MIIYEIYFLLLDCPVGCNSCIDKNNCQNCDIGFIFDEVLYKCFCPNGTYLDYKN